jgi:hypothetical protein
MTDERADYADADSPPPRQWLVELAITFAMLVALLGLIGGMILVSVANGPKFD